jgi:hypothetical protein
LHDCHANVSRAPGVMITIHIDHIERLHVQSTTSPELERLITTMTDAAAVLQKAAADLKATAGVTLSVGGAAATPNTSDFADIYALTPLAVEDIGSSQGSTAAYGAFANLATS